MRRSLFLMLALKLAAAAVADEPTTIIPPLPDVEPARRIRSQVLDPAIPITVPISATACSVLFFPQPVRAVMGYGLTSGEDQGFVQFEHPDNSPIVAVRMLQDFKRLFMTVLMGDELFVFELVPSAEPVIGLKLLEKPEATANLVGAPQVQQRRLQYSPEKLVGLLHRATNEPVLRKHYSSLYEGAQRRKTDSRTDYGDVVCIVKEVHRFPTDDATVLIGTIENKNNFAISFDPQAVGVLLGQRESPAQLCDSSGNVPAKQSAPIAVVLQGDVDGNRAHLSVKNDYRFALPKYGRGEDLVWQEPKVLLPKAAFKSSAPLSR